NENLSPKVPKPRATILHQVAASLRLVLAPLEAVLLAAAPLTASAQTLFADDFESLQLMSPLGKWSSQFTAPDAGVGVVQTAAHGGDAGFRAVDQTVNPSIVTAETSATLTPVTQGSLFLRYWIRISPDAPSGSTGIHVGDIPGALPDGGPLSPS